MSEELKPCPFCGGMPKVNDWTLKGITDKRCFCDNEKCPVYLSKTIAIDDWNARPIEDDLRKRIAELEEQVWDLNLANEKLESAYFADETIAPDGSLKPSVCKLMKRVEKAETDYSISEAHVTALLNRIAELEGLIDQLIEIGKGLDDGYEHYRFSEQTIPLIKLRKLTADWKEREE